MPGRGPIGRVSSGKREVWTETHKDTPCEHHGRDGKDAISHRTALTADGCNTRSWDSLTASEGASPAGTWSQTCAPACGYGGPRHSYSSPHHFPFSEHTRHPTSFQAPVWRQRAPDTPGHALGGFQLIEGDSNSSTAPANTQVPLCEDPRAPSEHSRWGVEEMLQLRL